MAEEVKAATAATSEPVSESKAKKSTAKKPTQKASTPNEKYFTADEVKALIAEALREQQNELTSKQNPQVVMQVKKEETVTLLFLGAIADGTVVSLGKLGTINRAGGTIDVPKSEFFQGIDYKVERMLQKRKIIVLSGLTDEERERFGVLYKDGELLTQDRFFRLLDIDLETLKKIYAKLCDEHKRIVATLFITAYERGDVRVNAEKVQALNRLSKKVDKDGLFTSILKDFAEKMVADEDEADEEN